MVAPVPLLHLVALCYRTSALSDRGGQRAKNSDNSECSLVGRPIRSGPILKFGSSSSSVKRDRLEGLPLGLPLGFDLFFGPRVRDASICPWLVAKVPIIGRVGKKGKREYLTKTRSMFCPFHQVLKPCFHLQSFQSLLQLSTL